MPNFNNFINKLSQLPGATVHHLDTNQSFIQHTGYKNGLGDFVTPFPLILIRDQWRSLGEGFTMDYQAKFGRHPFINPLPRSGLILVPSIDNDAYDEAVRRLDVYKEWFTSQIVTTCENAIVLYPIAYGLEQYRDESLNTPPSHPPSPYVNLLQASGTGVPDYTVPIGSIQYESKVTLRTEELPVSVGIIGGVGCDGMLLDLIVKLGESTSDFNLKVKTGRNLY